jgi:hypothetical protein
MFDLIKKWVSKGSVSDGGNSTKKEDVLSVTAGIDFIGSFGPQGRWVGVDLDGTLAHWDDQSTLEGIGKPIPAMVSFVQSMVADGVRVKIFTARAGEKSQIPLILKWLESNGLPRLEITNLKDYGMQRFYDDRGVQVEKNTGRIISD